MIDTISVGGAAPLSEADEMLPDLDHIKSPTARRKAIEEKTLDIAAFFGPDRAGTTGWKVETGSAM